MLTTGGQPISIVFRTAPAYPRTFGPSSRGWHDDPADQNGGGIGRYERKREQVQPHYDGSGDVEREQHA